MATSSRNMTKDSIHHIYNRGVLKITIFHEPYDYKFFIGRLYKYGKRYPIDMLAYCLMPNHFHFVIRETGETKPIIPTFMQQLQATYAKYYGNKYRHPGRVFQGTYKSKFITSEKHLNDTLNYVLNNPIKDSYVTKVEDWKWNYLKGVL